MTTLTLPAIEPDEFLDLAHAHTPIVCADLDGLRFLISTTDRGAGRALYLRGRRPDMRTLPAAIATLHAHGIRPTGCFIDVGANIGTTTLTAISRCGFTTAVAIEPDQTNARLLAATVALNNLTGRIRVIHAAALDHSRGARLRRHRSVSTRHSIDPTGELAVPSVTLDGLSLDEVGLLWIDAEGSEGQVLAGAQRLLGDRPPIVLEFNPQSLREHNGLPDVLDVAAAYRESVHARTGEALDLERLTVELDGHGGKDTRRVDVLLIP